MEDEPGLKVEDLGGGPAQLQMPLLEGASGMEFFALSIDLLKCLI